jgi:two-component system, OmpR family, sensor histidine kinase BaeS
MPDSHTPGPVVAPVSDVTPKAAAEKPKPKRNGSAKNGKRRRRTFRWKLAFAFALVAAITVGLAGILLSAAWSYQFDQYVRMNLQMSADGIASIVQDAYPQSGFTIETLVQVPRFGNASIGVQILDEKNQVVYDEASMRRHMQNLAAGQVPNESTKVDPTKPSVLLQPQGTAVNSPVVVNGKQVGVVRVWSYGAGALLTDRDNQFRRGSFMGLALAALVAIAFSSVAGIWYANRLVRPIERITETAQALKAGDPDARTGLKNDDEIGFLGKTFDEMADSIEADREMERRLTADVAHELRTPLQAIQATVEAMQDGVLPADEERLGIVRDETRRLARLADGILELTRLERGAVPFAMTRLDAAQPIRSAVDALEPLVETCELTLSTDIAYGLWIEGDSDRLQQAVGNLVSNAARYTPAGGKIEVRLRREDSSAIIEVADTGVGIAEEDIPRVFSRFWRADSARATATGGLGIGLAVTKEIVERHNGTIVAERRPTGGSVFRISIPLA